MPAVELVPFGARKVLFVLPKEIEDRLPLLSRGDWPETRFNPADLQPGTISKAFKHSDKQRVFVEKIIEYSRTYRMWLGVSLTEIYKYPNLEDETFFGEAINGLLKAGFLKSYSRRTWRRMLAFRDVSDVIFPTEKLMELFLAIQNPPGPLKS
jgi:hypothetical protein